MPLPTLAEVVYLRAQLFPPNPMTDTQGPVMLTTNVRFDVGSMNPRSTNSLAALDSTGLHFGFRTA